PGRWVPRYWMVTFSRIPYATAFERGGIQARLLRQMIEGKQSLAEIDLDQADLLVQRHLQPIAASA
ncbi:MAG TPA: FAD-dependent monooxygenase, partial [Dokdonella sp.]|nr:FAD-dependent monooxygenase [Dokdonella sp.]